MRTHAYWARVALGSLMIGAATTAAADDSGFYLGADGGHAKYPGHAHLTVGTATVNSIATTNTVFASSFEVGYRFSRYFALEAGYVDLGEAKATVTDFAGTSGEFRFKARGFTANAIGSLSLGNWAPFLKLGLLSADVEAVLTGVQNGTPFSFAGSDSGGFTVLSGIGAGYTIAERWHLKLELDYADDLGNEESTGEAHILFTSVGIAYRF
jgi:OOP family OmpA-OmpF porin